MSGGAGRVDPSGPTRAPHPINLEETKMPYTTQGFVTAADMAEILRDMDLDLCGCCEGDAGPLRLDGDGVCAHCGHEEEAHA